MSQAKNNITLIVKTLLNEQKIHIETAKSILENVELYEEDFEKTLNNGIGYFLEKTFPYTKAMPTTASEAHSRKEISSGKAESTNFYFEYTITRTPKRY